MSSEKFQATDEEREEATRIISKYFDFERDPRRAANKLSEILDKRLPNVKAMYAGLVAGTDPENAKIADTRIPRLMVDLLQLDLFQDKSLRRLLLTKLYQKEPENSIFWDDRNGIKQGDAENDLLNPERISSLEIVEKWKAGSRQALKFVRAFGFPDVFAGIATVPAQPSVENVEGPIILKDLRDFQLDIMKQVLVLLNQKVGKLNRGIIRLPTGAGKTRTVVEALIHFWKNSYWKNRSDSDFKYLLWIAHTEELCEQAFESFIQLWTVKGRSGEKLRLFRHWGERSTLPNLDDEGIIIAGIDKLYDGIRNNNDRSEFETGLASLSHHIGAVIVDEAHRSVTSMYSEVFKVLGIEFPSSENTNIPLLGLTATPYRGYDLNNTKRLLEKFNFKVLYPNGPDFDIKVWRPWMDMKTELTRQGILSQPVHNVLPTERTFDFDVDIDENAVSENISKFHKKNLEDIASDFERNKKIVNLLLELSNNWKSILYFAPSVNNANIMSAILRHKGISSAVVTSGTNRGIRQKYIRKFKEQTIKVLCNYGVLTTGFDAPLIDAIVIGRPTESRNLYEQMIGRGLRGPVFGGTEKCLIMDLLDNITIHSSEGPEKFLDKSIEFWDNMDKNDEYNEESLLKNRRD